jgi:hypothetical protein
MSTSSPPEPVAWGWRKYQAGVPVWDTSMVPASDGHLMLWTAEDHGQLPHLNRWENMEVAFAGFVGNGGGTLACAYWLAGVMKLLKDGDLMLRTWNSAVDVAEAVEFIEYNLLGVWFGDKTPFLLTPGPEWIHESAQKEGTLLAF